MENSIENIQNKKYFKNIDEAIKVYEEFRRFKSDGFIESIDADFFFNLTDIILSDYKRVLKADNYELNNRITDLLENIPIQKVKNIMKDMQKEYNKLDEQVDEYINDANKDLSKYYENKERIGTMQTLGWFIGTLQELLEK